MAQNVNVTKNNVQDYWLFELYIEKMRHLKDITLTFKENLIGISGENGTGKSTILALIACKHSRKSPNYKDNDHFLFKDGEYFTISNFMKKTKYDVFESDWKAKYIVKTSSNDGKQSEDTSYKYFERTVRYTNSNTWLGFKNEDRFSRPLFYWRWKDNIPSLENPQIIKYMKDDSLSSNKDEKYFIDSLNQSLQHVFVDKTLHVQPFKETENNPYTSVYHVGNHSTYNSASGKDKVIRLLALVHKMQKQSLLLIDEFEVGLHPSVQKNLLNELRSIAKSKELQIILTTHSRDVIDALHPSERIHLKNIHGQIQTYYNPSEKFIFSDMSHDKLKLFCEDETAALWIETIMKQNGMRAILGQIEIVPIGSCSSVIDHCKSTFINEKLFYAVLDGDKLLENELENKIKSKKYFGKMEDSEIVKLKEMYNSNLYYLPSELAPEKLFYTELLSSNDFKTKFMERFNIQQVEFDSLLNDLTKISDHHRYFEHIAAVLEEKLNSLICESFRLLMLNNDSINEACKILALNLNESLTHENNTI